jgi:hypothetical protein
MANATFSGPVRVGVGDNSGTVMATRSLALAVTATANTDLTMTVPKGKIVTLLVLTGTAFGAVTDAQIQIGSTVGASDYVAGTSIKAAAKVSLSFAAALLAWPTLSEGTTLYIRIVQSGTASATGAANLLVEYLPVAA